VKLSPTNRACEPVVIMENVDERILLLAEAVEILSIDYSLN
jgi:hypothetical protein